MNKFPRPRVRSGEDAFRLAKIAIRRTLSSQLDPNTMNKSLALLALAAAGLFSSCAQPAGPNTQRGAVIGALGGAAAGAIIGNQSGHAGEGALIGAGVGAAGGAAIGNAQDQENRRRYYEGY